MSTCDPARPCEKCRRTKADLQATAPKKIGCIVVTKYGEKIELDRSISEMKKFRRARKKLDMDGGDHRAILDCSKIKTILPLPA